jgi:pyruvate,water dikinase
MEKKRANLDLDLNEKYVKWLSQLSAKDIPIAGGKGANLAEMYNIGLPVPPAFIITAQAFDAFLTQSKIKEEINKIIQKTNVFNTKELDDNSKKIHELVVNAELPEDMQKEITEAYELLSTENKKDILDEDNDKNKTKKESEGVFVAVRSSATTEDLADASFAGQQETFTNIKGNKSLLNAVKKCFASLYTARAVYYRHKKGFAKANALLSVVVQKMINSEKSGVIFTKNPMNKKDEIIIEAVFGLGEGIVSGKISPDHYVLNSELDLIDKKIANKKIALIKEENGNGKEIKLDEEKSKSQVLTTGELGTLGNLGQKIENHYKKPQDIEFAISEHKVYIVQSRPITTLGKTKEKEKIENKEKTENKKITGEVILTGQPASPGIASGTVRIIREIKDLEKVKKGDILVTTMTNPDMVVAMQRASAIVTDEGGLTSHASIISREMAIPCVVGTETSTQLLKDGQLITVDGENGKIYKGKTNFDSENNKKEILPIVSTKTKIKVMVDLPDFAERAAKSQCNSVGLVRLEGIIAESGKHPLMFLRENKLGDYSKIIEKGITEIAKHFKTIWIRTSDIRTDEYQHLAGAPKQIELNPMLGFHGIRFSLKNLGILEAEMNAIKNTAEKYPDKKFGIMFPQIISENEIEQAYKIFHTKYHKNNIVLGAMIETPAAVQLIRHICKYVKFISFGTNDLTQYTLAVDRGNSECQYLYDETHPAVLSQLKRVIDICKEYKVESSICGQAGSKKEMVEHLVKYGIDSISVNADTANEISVFVAELEKNKNAKNLNPNLNNQNNKDNMEQNKKSKILPIGDTKEIEKKIEEKKQEVEKKKLDKAIDNSEVKSEQEEFPEFELGFDPFSDQSKN